MRLSSKFCRRVENYTGPETTNFSFGEKRSFAILQNFQQCIMQIRQKKNWGNFEFGKETKLGGFFSKIKGAVKPL